jgi:hypothetical protein
VAEPTDLTDVIAEEAASPSSSASDGQSATGRPLADLIAADRYLAAKAAAQSRRKGLTFSKLIPPGTLPDGGCVIGVPFGGGVTG